MLCLFFVFFFKQKTAYEMRTSDWSSDVCSSDLYAYEAYAPDLFRRAGLFAGASGLLGTVVAVIGSLWRARQGRFVTTYGSSRWATRKEAERAGLFEPRGVFPRRLGSEYLRHEGPEHSMAFAPGTEGDTSETQ